MANKTKSTKSVGIITFVLISCTILLAGIIGVLGGVTL